MKAAIIESDSERVSINIAIMVNVAIGASPFVT